MADPNYSAWLQGKTDSGRTVHIDRDPYMDRTAVVAIDGTVARIVGLRRMRDGGTTTIETDRGRIHWPNRINAAGRVPGQVPTLDGEELGPL